MEAAPRHLDDDTTGGGIGVTRPAAAPPAPERTDRGSMWLLVRSIAWTLALPGVVAGYVPWRFFGFRVRVGLAAPQIAGIALTAAGALLLIACVAEFARIGRGTLSPIDPPRVLVARGLYRYVRNPMYVSVGTIILGEAIWASSVGLAVYWLAFVAATNVFVIAYEEPALRRQFGASYDAYAARVGRWIPTLGRR